MTSSANIVNWNKLVDDWDIINIINQSVDLFSPRLAFGCSFSLEDMVLLHHLLPYKDEIEVFYLDTGRFHEATYQLIAEVEKTYDLNLKAYFPDSQNLQSLISRQGVNGFYDSLENRRECCRVRKVEPLSEALSHHRAWLTGLRREQSQWRQSLNYFQIDNRNKIKISPLRDWTLADLYNYQQRWQIPINNLYEKGYKSIGCEPCTRAIAKGENLRQGRWWWETKSHKECGLHSKSRGAGNERFQ